LCNSARGGDAEVVRSALAKMQSLEALESARPGAALPAAAEIELQLASRSYDQADVAECHLQRAYALAPEHAATHIGLYRFYFYRNRLREALVVGMCCLAFAARCNGLAQDWTAVRPPHAEFDSLSALPRFYLFTLKACAYLSLRLGEREHGSAMLDKLAELDPTDKVNATVLRDVLSRAGGDHEE